MVDLSLEAYWAMKGSPVYVHHQSAPPGSPASEECRKPSLEYRLSRMDLKSRELGFSALEHQHIRASLAFNSIVMSIQRPADLASVFGIAHCIAVVEEGYHLPRDAACRATTA